MDKLKDKISQYGKWAPIDEYIVRIETHLDSDFSISLENAKALLETIGKEICKSKGRILAEDSSVNGVLKNAFSVLGYTKSNMVVQISSALATIGQQIGELRNDIGTSSHGKTLEELKNRNEAINELTKFFLINSIELVACFLISLYEGEHIEINSSKEIGYDECEDFNEYWDELYGEFSMGGYSYTASEILYNNDPSAYETEYNSFLESTINENEE